jgi:hypothetical protein
MMKKRRIVERKLGVAYITAKELEKKATASKIKINCYFNINTGKK